jgi:U3 small nucleolar RNA-associated protein 18
MSSRRGASKGEEKALASKLFGNLGETPLVADDDGVDDGLFGKTPAAFVGGETERVRDGAEDDAPTGAVWEDPDDAKSTVNIARLARLRKLRVDESETDVDGARYVARIRKQHRRLNPRTGWADVQKDASNSKHKNQGALSGLLREGGALVDEDGGLASMGRQVPQGTLEATRVRDANAAEPSNSVLRSVEFHQNNSLFMTAGLDKSVRLFDIDGTNNPKVQGVFFEDLPVHKACFSGDGRSVVAAGRRNYFYVYDLAKGAVERVAPLAGREEKSLENFAQSPHGTQGDPMLAFIGADGHVPLVSMRSRSCVGAVQMSGACRSAAFSGDGRHLLTAGGDGVAYVWDLRNQRRCVEKIVDDGALTVTALASSPTGRHVAFGSDSGVVNVYETSGFRTWGGSEEDRESEGSGGSRYARATKGAPLRALMNLTTSVDALTFNGDGQMLATSSRLKRDSLRLVHLPSCTVFSNWPSSKTPLHYVWCTAFSPTGGYLAVGNARGRALLYRIHAYGTGRDE